MGHTFADVKLINPYNPSKCLEMRLLVDTGSAYSWVKKSRLEELGIKPMTRWRFKTIDGKIIEREIGEAIIECLNERATRIVVFANESDAEVLGVDALEGLRLELDPVTKVLKKVEALFAL